MNRTQDPGCPLYVSDLDGTLAHCGRLDPESVRLLNSAIQRGVLVTFATARSWTSARRLLTGVELSLPLVLHNGSVTLDPLIDRPVTIRTIAQALAHKIVLTATHAGLCPMVHVVSDRELTAWCSETEDQYVRAFWAGRSRDPRQARVENIGALPIDDVVGVVALGERRQVERLRSDLEEDLGAAVSTALRRPSAPEEGWWLEVTAAGVSKGTAVRELADQLGIHRVVSFGDELNDLSLFASSDESYAVGNAPREVRQAASGQLGTDPIEVAAWIANRGVARVRRSTPAGNGGEPRIGCVENQVDISGVES